MKYCETNTSQKNFLAKSTSQTRVNRDLTWNNSFLISQELFKVASTSKIISEYDWYQTLGFYIIKILQAMPKIKHRTCNVQISNITDCSTIEPSRKLVLINILSHRSLVIVNIFVIQLLSWIWRGHFSNIMKKFYWVH